MIPISYLSNGTKCHPRRKNLPGKKTGIITILEYFEALIMTGLQFVVSKLPKILNLAVQNHDVIIEKSAITIIFMDSQMINMCFLHF